MNEMEKRKEDILEKLDGLKNKINDIKEKLKKKYKNSVKEGNDV
jgi:peptidoglycan hydrolase CwlO-like protein